MQACRKPNLGTLFHWVIYRWASLPRDEDNSTFSVWAEMEYQSSQERLTDFKHVFLVYVLPPLVAFIIVSYLTWRLILWFILYRKVHYGVYQIPAGDIVFIETSKERYRLIQLNDFYSTFFR